MIELFLFICGIILIVVIFMILHDYFLFRKFKVGYRIDLYEVEHISLGTSKKIDSYKILGRKGGNISVLSPNNKIVDLDLYELISTIDMIVITDEKCHISDIVYKIERYTWF